jgi:hypothetical protein
MHQISMMAWLLSPFHPVAQCCDCKFTICSFSFAQTRDLFPFHNHKHSQALQCSSELSYAAITVLDHFVVSGNISICINAVGSHWPFTFHFSFHWVCQQSFFSSSFTFRRRVILSLYGSKVVVIATWLLGHNWWPLPHSWVFPIDIRALIVSPCATGTIMPKLACSMTVALWCEHKYWLWPFESQWLFLQSELETISASRNRVALLKHPTTGR